MSLHATFVPDSYSKLALPLPVPASITRVSCAIPLPPKISFRLLAGTHSGNWYLATNLSKPGASLWYIDKKPGLATDRIAPVGCSVLIPG